VTLIKGTRPEQYAGALQHFDEIPQRYRLGTYAGHYRNTNVWDRYKDEVVLEEHDSERMRKTLQLGGDSWRQHMHPRDRHYVLPTLEDVNDWCEKLVDLKARQTCYEYYFLRVYDFFDYLKCHAGHPHLYNPLLLAAIEHEAPRHIWTFRVDRRDEVTQRE